MSYATLVQLIKGYLKTPQPEYIFCWQGGEPIRRLSMAEDIGEKI